MRLVTRVVAVGVLVASVSLSLVFVARQWTDDAAAPKSFSQNEIVEAGRKVFRAAADGEFPPPNVIGSLANHSGLRIEVRPLDLQRARGMRAEYVEVAGMPVRLVRGSDDPPAPTQPQVG